MKKMILLNPGPVTLTERVRRAMVKADWCHREPEFAELTQSLNARLSRVYPAADDEYAAVLLTGSGTLAVEAMLSTFAPRDSKTLVVANGVYGERMAAMLQAMDRPTVVSGAPWDAPIDMPAIERTLAGGSDISHVVAVHHETTTGRLNPVAELGALCHEYGCALLLDAVSSFGAESIDFHDWNLQAVAATANKCLHGVPGISFVVGHRETLSRQDVPAAGVYLDLRNYFRAQSAEGYSPFTQAVQAAFALDAALDEFEESGGWQKRGSRYREIGTSVRQGLNSLGIDTFIDERDYSSVMYSYRLPARATYRGLHDSLKEQGFVIYAGQGKFADSMFRIAHMGAIRDSDVERLNRALAAYFDSIR